MAARWRGALGSAARDGERPHPARFRLAMKSGEIPDYFVVLDMDGVVLDSESAKIAAFKNLFMRFPDKIDEIDAYNRRNRGIPRKQKFEFVIKEILRHSLEDCPIEPFNMQYSSEVMKEMKLVPLIAGVENFLQTEGTSFFLNSSAPQSEIVEILNMKGLTHFFDEIYGYPRAKAEVLESLKSEFGEDRITFFGDALADYEAATRAGVRFVGVGSNPVSLFGDDVPIIENSDNLDHVLRLIKS
jgi:phosphoglycolate phosphatase-like HAD superfamily hydrolase